MKELSEEERKIVRESCDGRIPTMNEIESRLHCRYAGHHSPECCYRIWGEVLEQARSGRLTIEEMIEGAGTRCTCEWEAKAVCDSRFRHVRETVFGDRCMPVSSGQEYFNVRGDPEVVRHRRSEEDFLAMFEMESFRESVRSKWERWNQGCFE